MTSLNEFHSEFKQTLAQAATAGAQTLLQDIQGQVPVLTGTLRSSYRVEPATSQNLEASVVGGTNYGGDFYPFTDNFGRRDAALSPVKRLFSAPQAKQRREEAVRQRIEVNLAEFIRKTNQ
ncbi:hypothetical protein D0962_23210 [Leptolyngbyaceae cyanobacterium CCMR0082]|uniref:Uncharacterized protein n=1 Tax=Adonisia turfae CCMR0082 TaxID=2304604 RepID=A0A6M0SAU6_9CYAN|nr:HK97 gp10 family phage protein [Adonisia turfae]NEZ65629.1 hypothetical protein [Adonisia turfae CCMR0082]